MPRFYFDVREGEQLTLDEEGAEFPDLAAVRQEAMLALIDVGRDILSEDSPDIIIEVRDESGEQVVRAKISIVVEDVTS